MANVVYIGDEATAAGYRLAGVEAHAVAPGETAETFQQACRDGADLVLMAGTHAATLPVDELEEALVRETPLLAIVGDVLGGGALPDLAGQVRRALGIEA
jgi:vacuolar-type H+-ATPase subunit F/Vma7